MLRAVSLDEEAASASHNSSPVRMIEGAREEVGLIEQLRRVKEWALAVAKEMMKRACSEDFEGDGREIDPRVGAISAYLEACARYSVAPNGAVLAAFRFGSRVVKPRGASFSDAELLAVVDACCEAAAVRGIDLSAVDGSKLFAVAPAIAHCVANGGRGHGLSFVALAEDTPLGAHGAEALAEAMVNSPLRALKAAKCGVGDRGAEALCRAAMDSSSKLERLDLSSNGIGSRTVAKLAQQLRSKNRTVKLRGNALDVEMACAVPQCVGALLTPIAGWFLVSEARRLDLDKTAVASCAAYALSLFAYFAITAWLHLAEVGGDYTTNGIDFADLAALSTYAVVAAAHAPFLAFVDLGLPLSPARFFAAAALLAMLAACRRRVSQHHDKLDPPAARPTSAFDSAALALLGSGLLCTSLATLKLALGASGIRLLLTAAAAAAFAILLDLRPSNKPLAYVSALIAAGLHYATVLTALVWHFLPPLHADHGADAHHPPF